MTLSPWRRCDVTLMQTSATVAAAAQHIRRLSGWRAHWSRRTLLLDICTLRVVRKPPTVHQKMTLIALDCLADSYQGVQSDCRRRRHASSVERAVVLPWTIAATYRLCTGSMWQIESGSSSPLQSTGVCTTTPKYLTVISSPPEQWSLQ